MTAVLSLIVFAALFALFGAIRHRSGCAGCTGCSNACAARTKEQHDA
jgi:hypothetical protein